MNNKRNNWTWLEGLLTMKNFLEEGKLVVGDASVACVVPHCYPLLKIFGIMQEYCSLVPRPHPVHKSGRGPGIIYHVSDVGVERRVERT